MSYVNFHGNVFIRLEKIAKGKGEVSRADKRQRKSPVACGITLQAF